MVVVMVGRRGRATSKAPATAMVNAEDNVALANRARDRIREVATVMMRRDGVTSKVPITTLVSTKAKHQEAQMGGSESDGEREGVCVFYLESEIR